MLHIWSNEYKNTNRLGKVFGKGGIALHSRTGILPLPKGVMRVGMTRLPMERERIS
jgi:hypothetical protein